MHVTLSNNRVNPQRYLTKNNGFKKMDFLDGIKHATYCTVPYHIHTRQKLRRMSLLLGGGWGWTYMTHKISCCSNSRVIAFFNNFCPAPNGGPTPAEEGKNSPQWVALVRMSQIGSSMDTAPTWFFKSPLLSQTLLSNDWESEGRGQVKILGNP